MFWHFLIPFWNYLSHFLPLLSHSPPWPWCSRFSMIVWSTTSPQIKHRQVMKGPFGPENSSWIIIPLHRAHFILSSQKLSPWDHGDWNKVNAVFFWVSFFKLERVSNILGDRRRSYPPINKKFPCLNLVVYRSEGNFYSAFYLIFCLYYNLLSFLGLSDVFKGLKAWGQISILELF
jgi:hypothetical protein